MATQKAYASYQEIIDLSTQTDKVSAIGIHTPQGDTPRKMFGGFFDQFKKYKYLGASVTLVPAARLPADPMHVALTEGGEPTIDPRDLLNPILFHGCHGNDMGSILNKLYGNPDYVQASDSLDVLESNEATVLEGYVGTLQRLYYMALTDNTWRKAHPMKGFKKTGLRPLVYDLASTRQIAPGSFANASFAGFDSLGDVNGGVLDDDDFTTAITRNTPQLITPRLTGLGWLDTRNVLQYSHTIPGIPSSQELGDPSAVTAIAVGEQCDVYLPKIFMGIILLPPAYLTEQYFRMIINHHFAFKGFRGVSLKNEYQGFGTLPDNVVDASDGWSDDPEPEPPTPPSNPDVSYTLADGSNYEFTVWLQSDLSSIGGEKVIAGTSSTSGNLPKQFELPVGIYYMVMAFSSMNSDPVAKVNGVAMTYNSISGSSKRYTTQIIVSDEEPYTNSFALYLINDA